MLYLALLSALRVQLLHQEALLLLIDFRTLLSKNNMADHS